MADNTTLNTGSGGDVISTDDIAGVKVQRVKVQYGADGSATDVSDANPLPIDDAGGSLTVDNAALSVTGGGVEASALRVTLANDSTGLVSVDDGGGSLTIDGTVTANLSATDNAVLDDIAAQTSAASVAAEGAALASGILIQGDDGTDRKNINVDATTGDVQVDVTNTVTVDGSGVTQPISGTVTANLSATDNAVLDQIEVNTSYGDNTGGGVEAGSLRVTLASDSTGLVSVDDNGGSLTVDNAALSVTGGGTEASALRVTIANNSTGVVSVDDNGGSITVDNGGTFATQATLQAGSASIGTLGANSGIDIGDVDVTSISAGSNAIGDVGITVRTSGGTTLYKNIDVDESEDQIKATAGQIYWIHCMNLSASVRFLKIYNATAATVVVGTTVPDLTFPLPTQGDTNGAGFTFAIPNGIVFSTAITIAATTGIADADSGSPGANEVVCNIGYA